MSKLISVGTCDAPFILPQQEVKNFIYSLFSDSYKEIERMINVFDNSSILNRHISIPVEWLAKEHSFKERNEIFRETAVKLSENAINECLGKINAEYEDINNIIFITSTGVTTPTIDALLFNKLKLDKHINRTPIWGLGCAGGASGVSRAMDYCKANSSHNTLVLAVELCSLTFQKNDLSKSNIIASSLFSDGCAAAFICGENSKYYNSNGACLISSLSTIYKDSLDIMGWEIINEGFKVVFSRDIPVIVKEYVKPNIEELIEIYGLRISDIKHFVTHPGGLKVINAYEEALNLQNGYLENSRKVLREHGNMSSPSVLYVMKEFLNNEKINENEFGLLSALGPGFSSELVLFKTS